MLVENLAFSRIKILQFGLTTAFGTIANTSRLCIANTKGSYSPIKDSCTQRITYGKRKI
jgi:hypothetical protein